MTAMVEAGEPAVGLRERIGTITLVKGSIARLRRAGLALLWLWLAAAAGGLVVTFAGGSLGVDPATPTLSAGYLAFAAANSLAAGVTGGLALRLLIAGPSVWLRLDRPLVEGVGILCAVSLALSLYGALFAALSNNAATGVPSGGGVLASLALLAGYFLLLFAWLRIPLWPAARLMGRNDIGPAQSWRLMKKATRGLVLGYALFAIPIAVVMGVFMQDYLAGDIGRLSPPMVIMQFAGVAFAIAAYGLVATIYTLRVETPATVAEVFD